MKKYLYLFMVCSLSVSCHQEMEQECCTFDSLEPCDVYALAEMPAGRPAKPGIWDYPVKPGTEEWKQFQGNEEMVRACQIPKKALSSLSTEDLTYICLRYPLLSDVFAFNLLSDGANKLYNDFNGIRELFKRKKVSKELLKYYNCLIQNMSVLDGEVEGIRQGAFIFSVRELEFLLGFYTQKAGALSKEDCKEMLRCLVHGHEKEITYYEPGFRYQFYTNFYARAHIIVKICPECTRKLPCEDQNGVFRTILGVDKETWDIINELSYQLIK